VTTEGQPFFSKVGSKKQMMKGKPKNQDYIWAYNSHGSCDIVTVGEDKSLKGYLCCPQLCKSLCKTISCPIWLFAFGTSLQVKEKASQYVCQHNSQRNESLNKPLHYVPPDWTP